MMITSFLFILCLIHSLLVVTSLGARFHSSGRLADNSIASGYEWSWDYQINESSPSSSSSSSSSSPPSTRPPQVIPGQGAIPASGGFDLEAIARQQAANDAQSQYLTKLIEDNQQEKDINSKTATPKQVPRIRYAHSAVSFQKQLIITHGYLYDLHGGGGATWLSDTWSFDHASKKWTMLHPHITDPNSGPIARYAATAILSAGDMYLHGGDDGGHSLGYSSYRHSLFGDMWRFILSPSSTHSHQLHRWVRIEGIVASTWLFQPSSFFSSPTSSALVELASLSAPSQETSDFLFRSQHGACVVPTEILHKYGWKVVVKSQQLLDHLQTVKQTTSSSAASSTVDLAPFLSASQAFHSRAPMVMFTFGGLGLYPRVHLSAQGTPVKTDEGPADEGRTVIFSQTHGIIEKKQPESNSPTSRRFEEAHDNSELWMFNFYTNTWHPILTQNAPSKRFGTALAYSTVTHPTSHEMEGALYLYGGYSRLGKNFGDLWAFSFRTGRWLEQTPVRSNQHGVSFPLVTPGPRAYHQLVVLPQHLLLFGGARCEPGCVCSSETWMWSLTSHRWEKIVAPPRSPDSTKYPSFQPISPNVPYRSVAEAVDDGYPVHRYKHTLVALPIKNNKANGFQIDALLFGGESYNPSGYHNDVWKLSLSATNNPSPDAVTFVQEYQSLQLITHDAYEQTISSWALSSHRARQPSLLERATLSIQQDPQLQVYVIAAASFIFVVVFGLCIFFSCLLYCERKSSNQKKNF